jgi:hypothetical protein
MEELEEFLRTEALGRKFTWLKNMLRTHIASFKHKNFSTCFKPRIGADRRALSRNWRNGPGRLKASRWPQKVSIRFDYLGSLRLRSRGVEVRLPPRRWPPRRFATQEDSPW